MKPQVGDVIQIRASQRWCDDLLMVVDEVRTWGVTGDVPTPQGPAPMRVRYDEIKTVWRRQTDA